MNSFSDIPYVIITLPSPFFKADLLFLFFSWTKLQFFKIFCASWFISDFFIFVLYGQVYSCSSKESYIWIIVIKNHFLPFIRRKRIFCVRRWLRLYLLQWRNNLWTKFSKLQMEAFILRRPSASYVVGSTSPLKDFLKLRTLEATKFNSIVTPCLRTSLIPYYTRRLTSVFLNQQSATA